MSVEIDNPFEDSSLSFWLETLRKIKNILGTDHLRVRIRIPYIPDELLMFGELKL
jgi:hypothetical protein